MNILLGVTGSVASIYTENLRQKLSYLGNVKVIATNSSQKFCGEDYINDSYENIWTDIGDGIAHIELRNWADVLVIAPLSANTLAKIYSGICDNLLTSIVRCWDFSKKIVLCPSMNCEMWDNYPTDEQIKKLKDIGFLFISPIVKRLACGDTGIGALCDHDDIVDKVKEKWFNPLNRKLFVPVDNHPGSFAYHRKGYFHTGVDLYCNDGDSVYSVEDGKVVSEGILTGPKIGTPHWNETYYVAIKGESGIVVYGELYEEKPSYKNNHYGGWNIGSIVAKGSKIGKIKQVIPDGKERPDIPYHSKSMLHIELYRHHDNFTPFDWKDSIIKNRNLLNPTNRLLLCNSQ